VADTTAPSVLLVVLDTTGAAHLPTYGYDRPISPNVTALARRSLVYRRALAAAPWTLPSHASIFSGRYPSELGFDGWNFDPERVTGSIAGDLAASGRRGWAVSANPILPGVFPLGAGFERVWGVEQLTHPVLLTVFDRLRHREGFQSRGSRVTALALDWLDRLSPRRRPWFLCLNYLDPHAPYRPPEVFAAGIDSERLSDFTQMYNTGRVPVTGELRAAMRDLYDGEIAAMDTAVGELLRGLERRGYDDSNLLVIVTADHGESLGDHGFVGHLLGMPDAVLRVPLLISGLGVEAGEVPTPVQVVQLRATIRALLGLEALPDIAPALPPWGQAPSLLIAEHPEPHWYFEELRGFKADLDAEPWRGNWVAAERDGLKVVFDDRGRGVTYDLRRDGGEAHPLPLSDGAEVVAAYRAWQNGAPATGTQVVSEEARRALEGLGYLR
jgi:arylsulfatase A-like enzyme